MTFDQAALPRHRLERTLAATLRFAGTIEMLAIIAAVMPADWMQGTHQALQLGAYPEVPLFGYLARSASLMWALHGATIFYLAGDLVRFLPAVHFIAYLTLILGGSLLAVDLAEGMPTWWTATEGPVVIVMGAWFWYAARRVAKSHRHD